jgi:hypothetical protein
MFFRVRPPQKLRGHKNHKPPQEFEKAFVQPSHRTSFLSVDVLVRLKSTRDATIGFQYCYGVKGAWSAFPLTKLFMALAVLIMEFSI